MDGSTALDLIPLQQEQEEKALRAIVVDVLKECDMDREQARRALTAKFLADPDLLDRHIPLIVKQWAQAQVRLISQGCRNVVAERKIGSGEQDFRHAGAFKAMGRENLDNWLDAYRISTGMALGDCGREELENEIAMHRHFAETNAGKARWLKMIVDRVDGEHRVRDVLKNAQIAGLYKKAFKE